MTRSSRRERLEELLVARATEGLSERRLDELQQLLGELQDSDAERYDRAAAAIDKVFDEAHGAVEAMPAALQARLEPVGLAIVRGEAIPEQRPEARAGLRAVPSEKPVEKRSAATAGRTPSQKTSWMPWLAAAAMLVFAVVGWSRVGQQSGATTVEQRIASLEQRAGDLDRWGWTTTEDEAAAGASGEVIWSSSEDEGYMRIQGLAANNPGVSQYQLWIFDAERSADHPVDGGVFDIPEGVDEIVVPIDPKLGVSDATLFAVTVEQPGGVVVSGRERIVLLAQAAAG